MIALIQSAADPVPISTFERIVKDYGGWGVLGVVVLLAMWFGGKVILSGARAFMAMAQKFSTDVVAELKEIKTAIQGQDRRVDGLTAAVEDVRTEQAQQGEHIDRLRDLVAGQHKT